ncbi:hypothetical protein VchM-138_0042 [Vibrio phage vB_VchM-138]|uniref:hypothetical protein n=1 Tax=Vibrio phage vB_VchM-138 TaxID=1127518 RepID=UPI0002536E19|nr:hypothetical protein F397_gp42 [Vibrio phage vB_VchM-138]AFC22721.1 hypothetical protein VchM-138_0042 [Vibrio phage vB_VchM-138]
MSNTPHDIRVELCNKQRMQKTRDKWLSFCDQFKTNYNTLSESHGMKLGDTVNFAKTSILSGGCIRVSAKSGTVFAFGEKCFYVISSGKLERVSYQ